MAGTERLRLAISGAVQGVGFRPFVFRLARALDLAGWVINDWRGVFVEVEGDRRRLEDFRARVASESPPLAVVMKIEAEWLPELGFEGFSIRASDEGGSPTVVVLPDMATCDQCLAEVLDANDRRFAYPFTNCTNCGPRFSIIEQLPYDRPATTMRGFAMCADCLEEYREPVDRRFHAQPNACADCGPTVSLTSGSGEVIAFGSEAMAAAVEQLRAGDIVALKGLGGFLLLVDAARQESVLELRQRKGRYEKPLAVMVPDLESARFLCDVTESAETLLCSAESPIVLLDRVAEEGEAEPPIAPAVAPDNPRLGLMLPYTPLHHLLLRSFGGPLVATSGNISDEPICIDNEEARQRLGEIADAFLEHDRPIARHVDDSVVQIVDGRPQPIRRARGYAPLPIQTLRSQPTILAVGGHLKNAAALGVEDNVFLSQHIGDMETLEARAAFERVIQDFLELYKAEPTRIACDLHPDYPTTRWAERCVAGELTVRRETPKLAGLPLVRVQHHHAHLASCLAEHRIEARSLGVTWDGTGYGTDGSVWGGEFLLGNSHSFERIAALRPFRLVGGDAAVKEPRRVALALLWEMQGAELFNGAPLGPTASFKSAELQPLRGMLEKRVRSPETTSAGRLFDAVASLLELHQKVAFEGQAAMKLESVADPAEQGSYPLPLVDWRGIGKGKSDVPQLMLDWEPLIEAIVEDSRSGCGVGMIAARFHNALAEGIVEVAREVGMEKVVLTGGCFQNRLLSVRVGDLLRSAGFEVLSHRAVPANDGGLSLGQIAVAAAQLS